MSLWKKLSGIEMEMAAVLADFPHCCDSWPKQLQERRVCLKLTGRGYNPSWLLEHNAASASGDRGNM